MVKAVVGAGGKTTLIRQLAEEYRWQGKRVFVTTSTHMFIEEDTLLSEDADEIVETLKEKGYVMAGVRDGVKIKTLPEKAYEAVCRHADVVLVEADGSKHMPLKVPGDREPVIYDNVQEIIVVCGLHALGRPAREVCHRLDRVTELLGIEKNTVITPEHIRRMVWEGYVKPLREKHPGVKFRIYPSHDGSAQQQEIAEWIIKEQ